MLPYFLENTSVTIQIPLKHVGCRDGYYQLLDEDGLDVFIGLEPTDPEPYKTVVEVYGDDTFIEITIDEEFNKLKSDNGNKGLRVIKLVTTAENGNEYTQYGRYAIIADEDLVVPSEALMTVSQSHLFAMDMPAIDQFENADDFDRRRALIEASRRLDDLPLVAPTESYTTDTSNYEYLSDMPLEEFLALPTRFLRDLRKATLLEADDILGGDEVALARKQGVISESVGESTNMYQTSKVAEEKIGKRAFRIIAKYLQRHVATLSR